MVRRRRHRRQLITTTITTIANRRRHHHRHSSKTADGQFHIIKALEQGLDYVCLWDESERPPIPYRRRLLLYSTVLDGQGRLERMALYPVFRSASRISGTG